MTNSIEVVVAPVVAPPPPPGVHWAHNVDARIYTYVVLGKALQVGAVVVAIAAVVCVFAVSPLFLCGVPASVVLAIIGSKLRLTRLWPDNTLYIPWFTDRNFIENQPVGIHRTGNNCGFTSTFQFALQSESIREIIDQLPEGHVLRVAKERYLAAQQDHEPIANDLEIQRIREFVAAVARPQDRQAPLPIERRAFRQEDASDILNFLLDALENHHRTIHKNNAEDPTFVHQVVETMREQQTVPNKMLILQATEYLRARDEIAPGQPDEQTFVETFFGPYFRDRNELGAVTRRLLRFPQELIVQISRFDGRGRKINDPLPIPEQFTLPDDSILNGRPSPYELDAFLVHTGSSIGGGHYVAYVKSETPQGQEIWWQVDDSRTLPLYPEEFEAARKQAYILHYKAQAQE